ncbi:MAG: NAD(P)-dependent oxidoreductase [Betaproteobacteria bacterium]|nr:NAD(P)-dependent oxidoreductase [Betaproteobacteria bacterium]
MNKIKNLGFIGLGNMGGPMAAHLARAGYDLTVYDINPEASAKFVAQHGGRVAASLAALGGKADAVITMLPTDKIVNQVILGDGGVASTLARGGIVIDMSTSDPVATQALAAALKPRGIEVIDAPVMGGVVFAKDATLDIMAAGDAQALERVTPVLKSMGRGVTPCGAVGSAHALKALGNYINACAMINVVEAMAIGRKFGLDALFMADALLPMVNGRQHPLEKKVIPQILTRKFSTGMAMGLITKDIGITVNMAKALEAYAPLAECTLAQWVRAVEQFGGQPDQTEVAKLWEHESGITLERS